MVEPRTDRGEETSFPLQPMPGEINLLLLKPLQKVIMIKHLN